MVITGLDIIRYIKYKVYFESSKTGYQTGINYILIKDLGKKFEELYNQVIYYFINNTIIVVEFGKYKDFLANQKHLTNYKEFFYYGYNSPQKRYYSLDNTDKDLKSIPGPRA
jgi:hypothetical protein